MESDGQFMASGFGKVRNQLLSILGLFTAGMGIKNFTQSTIKQADAFGFMSDSIGMSTTRLRAYSDAAERAGGSGEAMTEALKKSASDVALLRTGQKSLADVDQGGVLTRWAGQAGLDPKKIFESGESLVQARLKVFETIRKTDKNNPLLRGVDPGVLANTVLEQGGIGSGVLNALKNKGGLDGFNKSIANQEKINSVLEGSEELARKARESWFDLTQQFEIIGQKIVVTLTPAFIKLTEYLKKVKLPSPEAVGKTIDVWIKKFSDLSDKTQKTINLISDKWNGFSEVVKKVTNNGVDLTDGFTVVATVIGGLVAINVLGWITGIVGALGTLVLAAGSAAGALAPLAAVAAAGAAGAYAGNKLYNNLGTDAQQTLQNFVGKTAALLGDKDAQQAVMVNEGKGTLGSLSSKYEGKVGSANKDNIGSAYGKYQFNSKTGGLNRFFADNPEYAKQFEGIERDSPEFYAKWKDIARNDSGNFEAAQDRSASNIWYAPAKEKAESLGFDMSNRGVQEAVFSGSIQHGGIKKLLDRVGRNNDLKSMTPEQQLEAFYAERRKYVRENLSGGVLAAQEKRYDKESQDALNLARQSQGKKAISYANSNAAMPPPVIIGKGEKDIYGRVKGASSLYESMPPVSGQTSPRVNANTVNIGTQTFNIKANDTEGIKKELANKMIISESLTQNFNSGMR
jgi:hypothetical protein